MNINFLWFVISTMIEESTGSLRNISQKRENVSDWDPEGQLGVSQVKDGVWVIESCASQHCFCFHFTNALCKV